MDTLNQQDLVEALIEGDVMTFDVENCTVELSHNGSTFLEVATDEDGDETEWHWNHNEIFEVYIGLEEEQAELYS